MKKFEIVIASLPNRENLVAEIYYDNLYWAEISKEDKDMKIQCYGHPTQKYWEFNLDEALEALQQAKKSMLDLDVKREKFEI